MRSRWILPIVLLVLLPLLFACRLATEASAGVLVDPSGTADAPSPLATRIIERLEAGELAAALRAAVPELTDEEIESVVLEQAYHGEPPNTGTQIICKVQAEETTANAAIQACIKAIQQALAASPGA
ncbi:MAG: hypothetical protein QNK05_14660 [Myxococcota bacterium]|nr:hypothetical protein [Myxococcota bacterium]